MAWAEAKWIVDNVMQKTSQTPNNMRAFTALSVSDTQIGLKFLEPSDSYAEGEVLCSVEGVMIRMSENDYPATPNDGVLVIDNKELGKYQNEALLVSNLTEGKTYYFSAFPYSTEGVYNLSKDGANRVNTISTEGEIVTVSISVDDVTDFKAVTVRCVDETDSTMSQLVSLSLSANTASVLVPVGHRYHIEWGSVYGYAKPENTPSKTAEAGVMSSYEATYEYFTATIDVTYPEGAILTCTLGGKSYTAGSKTGNYQFKVHAAGVWTLRAVDGESDESTTVEVLEKGQTLSAELSFVKIYGISRDITASSPVWARTDDAIGFTATASVGTAAGASSFDNCMPWAGMVRETLSTGDVMVKIPKFYFKRYREGNIEHIKIADKPAEGFAVHPLFNHAGVESEYAYIGAYTSITDSETMLMFSKKGYKPSNNGARATFRDRSKNKGTGWSLIDIAAVSAIQMLCMVEFATNNAQAVIGRGYCDNNNESAASGSCDSVPNLTGRPSGTDGKTGVVYRGIENFWGNVWQWVDGVNFNGGKYYVCNDQSKYADDTATGYEELSFTGVTSGTSYITEEGLDTGNNPHIMLPSAVSGGSASTYYCDCYWSASNWRAFICGGSWNNGSDGGLFSANFSVVSSYTDSVIGSRLLYIPS